MLPVYNFFLLLYQWAARLKSDSSPKAKKWVEGRKGIFEKIERALKGKEEKRVWFHSASLGEFEQGRPLIEMLKNSRPELKIFLTFFSPSGYEARKNYPYADYVFYMPMDSKDNARRFTELVKPELAVFIKYDFWYHYFHELQKNKIPLILISSVFRSKQPFFRWYGGLHRRMLKMVSYFFVQDENSKQLLEDIGIQNATIIPDTRIDRVFTIRQQQRELPGIAGFLNGQKAFIGGSIYQAENRLIRHAFNAGLIKDKIILAPHKIEPEALSEIKAVWGDEAVFYSQYQPNRGEEKKVLIIDSIGLLSALYRYGHIAFIGGGFGKGIHNTLEPAAFGLPVIFGPNYKKFNEAKELIQSGGAFSVSDQNNFESVLKALLQEQLFSKAANASMNFIEKNTGGTKRVYDWLAKNVL